MMFVYTPPGAYNTEVPRGASVALGTVPLALCLVGTADPNKTAQSETVRRGQILDEPLVVAIVSPYTAPLANNSNQETNQAVVYKDGAALPGTAWFFSAVAEITIADNYYSATSTYTMDYTATGTTVDALAHTGVQQVLRVGSLAGLSDFIAPDDYALVGNTISWVAETSASFTGINPETYDLTTLDTVRIAVDGRGPIEIAITGANQAAVTAAEVSTAINTALNGSPLYGIAYNSVAAPSIGGGVQLTSPNTGSSSSVELSAATDPLTDATDTIFGVTATHTFGTGKSPTVGENYYVTYTYARPVADYNVPTQVFNTIMALDFVGAMSASNQLAIASEIAFMNLAPFCYLDIVQDADFDGIYTDTDYITAIEGTEGYKGLTEMVALSPRLLVQTYLQASVTAQSSPLVGNRRRAWYGMARNTAIGNTTTVDTFVYRSAVTLQVPPQSPGRGRLILVAPSNLSRTIQLEDGTQVRVQLDGTFLSVAVAALQTSFTSVSQTLLRRNVVGFNVDDFQTYLDQESNILGAGGITVIRSVGGNLQIVDPMTTEAAGAGDVNYSEISARTQADLVATFLSQRVGAALVGAVPETLSGAVAMIKGIVGTALNSLINAGEIGPFTDSTGNPRAINYASDIIATQVPGIPTDYTYRFYFNARFPIKRLWGEFSVGGMPPAQ